jgi:hypothetical protein
MPANINRQSVPCQILYEISSYGSYLFVFLNLLLIKVLFLLQRILSSSLTMTTLMQASQLLHPLVL